MRVNWLLVCALAVSTSPLLRAQIPKVWNDAEVVGFQLPLATPDATPRMVSSAYYYRMLERPILRTYPVYHPSRQPAGYMDWLKQQEPEIVFHPAMLKTPEDWIKAGETIFHYPISTGGTTTIEDVNDPRWYERMGVPVAKNGTVPYFSYVIFRKGQVQFGRNSCAHCHTRVLADGTVLTGVPGNIPEGKILGNGYRYRRGPAQARDINVRNYELPWLRPDPERERMDRMSIDEIASAHEAHPAGTMARNGSSLFSPVRFPDLIGIKDRRYLDATGLVRHRGIGDLMRYASIASGSFVELFGEDKVKPEDALPKPENMTRFSDAALYAVANYVYSLRPPPNPNGANPLARQGEKIFQREGCIGCHTPPLYTNNKITPAAGFQIPGEHRQKYDVLPVVVGTDPTLAMLTRRGTGYYKVPSLRGVWYRGPFEHNGSVAELEDWFDPARLRDDYKPTGFVGYGVKTRAVKGHEFGLRLSANDRRALVAFLKTL